MGITEADAAGAASDTWDGTRPNTCLSGPRFVWHSLVLDLRGPGIAFLRAGLDYLRVGLGPGLRHENITRKLKLSISLQIFSCQTLPGALSTQTKQTGLIKG